MKKLRFLVDAYELNNLKRFAGDPNSFMRAGGFRLALWNSVRPDMRDRFETVTVMVGRPEPKRPKV